MLYSPFLSSIPIGTAPQDRYLYRYVFVCANSLWGAFTFLLVCRPIESYWNLSVPGKCLNFNPNFLAGGVFNVAADFTILSLPLWLLKPLRLPRKQKIGVLVRRKRHKVSRTGHYFIKATKCPVRSYFNLPVASPSLL
jgi:hypothetical protein